jgi:anti-sigma factor RsiW
MMKPDEHERVRLARYLDGEMSAEERVGFAARLRAEPALAELESEAQALRGIFACARREPLPALRAGFADRVLDRLSRPAGAQDASTAAAETQRVVRFARLCVAAAAVILVVATLFTTGALQLPDRGTLQADSRAELIRVLDAKIQAAQQAGARR